MFSPQIPTIFPSRFDCLVQSSPFLFGDVPSQTNYTKGKNASHYCIAERDEQGSVNTKTFSNSTDLYSLSLWYDRRFHSNSDLLSNTTPRNLCIPTLSTVSPFIQTDLGSLLHFLKSVHISFVFRNIQINTLSSHH